MDKRVLIILLSGGLLIPLVGIAVWRYGRAPAPISEAFPANDALIGSGDLPRAIRAAEERLASRPSDPALLLEAARLRFLTGDYPRGEELLLERIRLDPRSAPRWMDLARLEEESRRILEAHDAAAKAFALDPDAPGARAILARCHLAGRRFEEARDLLSPRIASEAAGREELVAYATALVRLGKHREATGVLERAAARGASPEERHTWAEALIGCGEFVRAADLLAEANEEAPHSSRGYLLLGTALARLGRTDAARAMMKAYEALIPLDQQMLKIHEMVQAGVPHRAAYELAVVEAGRARFDKALDACRRAIGLRPEEGEVVFPVLLQLDDLLATAEAEEHAGRAVAAGLQPAAAFLWFQGELLRKEGRAEEARERFDRALGANPMHGLSLLGRARLALEGRRLDEARTFAGRAREALPGDWQPLFYLGRSLAEGGDLAGARRLLGEAEAAAGGSRIEPRWAMGLLALGAGEAREALPVLLDCLKNDPLCLEAAAGPEEGMRVLGDAARAKMAGEREEKIRLVHDRIAGLRASRLPWEERGRGFLELAALCRDAGARREEVRFLQLARQCSPDLLEAHRAFMALVDSPDRSFLRIGACADVLRLAPDDPQASRILALTYARLGVRLDRAHDHARKAVAVEDSPESRKVLDAVLSAGSSGDVAAMGTSKEGED